MRKSRFVVGALCFALFGLMASSAFGLTANQTIEAVIGGKQTPKLDKKKFKKTSVFVETSTADVANPAGMPPKATQAVINFDKKNVKFDTSAAPKCDANQIENTSTQTALSACGTAKVGGGSAIAALPFGVGGTRQDFPAVVNAFNRADAKGILLHSRVDALGTTVVLKGTLAGTKLSVEIPPLGGGVGAIADFKTKVSKGKYIQARCKNKVIKTSSSFTFTDAPTATAQDKQKCKQK